MNIPLRLLSVAKEVIPGKPMADIGSDHALLPIYLISEEICPFVICGEFKDGPYARTNQAVTLHGLGESIEVRQGDGFEVLTSSEVATVVLAGMGGNTIIDILQRSLVKARSFDRLVLQPMNAIPELRALVNRWGWKIEKETVVWDGDYYINISVAPRIWEEYHFTRMELEYGPYLMRNAWQQSVREYYESLILKYSRLLEGIPQGSKERAMNRRLDFEAKIKELEEILR